MVHALEEIHRLLKPSGFLIDIHPVSEHSSIEIHNHGNVDIAGQLKVLQWCVDFEKADEALAEIVQRGKFVVEEKSMFDTLTHYDSVAEMGASFKESIGKFARDDESANEDVTQIETLTVRSEELLQAAGGGAELILREKDHISRLRPI